ncbi:STAS domain-containing protein [Sulfurovum sp. NBC37-1]|uniref:STAS domain-containing protein n=1 Tax=Sulfurovum sp. (strain NBC37-1) TaxID=387093 RepID=UPI00015875AB|nr:STAS domain-containing protein [Sulfurovum sp. NBC37-1]BAF71824.1 anti-sigma factor antagonist [Sulfurovum sp. NBC37-1]
MIEIRKDESFFVILSHRLDAMNADEAKEIVDKKLVDIDRDIVIDVSDLDYISSSGLQVVLKCAKLAQENDKECFLKGAHGTVKEIFQVSGFLTFLKEIE